MICANLFALYSVATRLASKREFEWVDDWYYISWWMYSTISCFALVVFTYNAAWRANRDGVFRGPWWRMMFGGGGCRRACLGEAAPVEDDYKA
jgi:hypothetical protein